TDRKYHKVDEGSTSLMSGSTTDSMDQTMAERGGSPGPRSNTQLSVESGGSSTDKVSESSETLTFDTAIGGTETQRVIPGGRLQKMNAVVNIPRDYFVSIWKSQQTGEDAPDPQAGPTDQDLAAVRDAELNRIKAEVA